MTESRYTLHAPVPAMTLDLLRMMEYLPSGAVVEVASECRQSGLIHLVWQDKAYLTCQDMLQAGAERLEVRPSLR